MKVPGNFTVPIHYDLRETIPSFGCDTGFAIQAIPSEF